MSSWVELRRHSYTKKGEPDGRGRGSHLSQGGIDAARVEGAALARGTAPVTYVGVSDSPRTMETAIAMGFAVDEVLPLSSAHVTGEVEFHEWWAWPDPWAVYAERIDARPKLADFAAGQADLVRAAAARAGGGNTALLVGHGGWIEPTVVAAIARADRRNWGPAFDHLEGVRLEVDGVDVRVDLVHRRPR